MSMEITSQNFEKEVLQASGIVLADFWASWCGPCRMLGPVVEQIAAEHPELKIGKLNVDEQGELAQRYNVQSIPTVIAFRGGAETGRSVGLVPKDKLLALAGL